jgi:hypothetical protein
MLQNIETQSLSIENDSEIEEFRKQMIQLQLTTEHIDGIENVDFNHFVNEIGEIGLLIISSKT